MVAVRAGVTGWVAAAALSLAACTIAESAAEPAGSAKGSAASRADADATASAPRAEPAAASALPAASASAAISAASAAVQAALASASASAVAEAAGAPCPADMVLVGRTCVDRHEAFLLVVGSDGSTQRHPYYERLVKGVTYRAANEAGAFPQGYISRVESKAACENAGKRLCSKAEWTRACKAKGWQTYPYGQQGKREVCNTGKLHLLSQMFKNPKGGIKYDDHFNSPELNKTPGYLAKSAEYSGCASELGVFDMVGNLHEWVSDTVTEDLMAKLDEEDVERRDQPWRVGNGVFMGGFYSTTSEHGPGCTFITVAHEPSYHDYSTGFRCCKAADLPKPEPKGKSKPKQK